MMWPWACQMVLKEQILCQFPKLQWKKWVFYIIVFLKCRKVIVSHDIKVNELVFD
jgi:hypothetical protein